MLPEAREILLKDPTERSGNEAVHALSVALGVVNTNRYWIPKQRSRFLSLDAGVLNWTPVGEDWRAHRRQKQEQEEQILEALQTPYNFNASSIYAVSYALKVPEEKVIQAIEQIADEVEIKQA